jgi:hypothetical protein
VDDTPWGIAAGRPPSIIARFDSADSEAMANSNGAEEVWLPVIGRALAYVCLKQAEKEMPDDFANVLDKFNFLTALGLPEADAAYGAGSNLKSVQVLRSRKKALSRARKK